MICIDMFLLNWVVISAVKCFSLTPWSVGLNREQKETLRLGLNEFVAYLLFF